MTLSLNLIELFKVFITRGAENRSKVIQYLDTLQSNADELVSIWEGVLETVKLIASGAIAPEPEKYPPNVSLFATLSNMYDTATVALGDKVDNDFRQALAYGLGSLMMSRHLTREAFDKAKNSLSLAYFSTQPSAARLSTMDALEAAVDSLRKDAAALRVLIINYKAK